MAINQISSANTFQQWLLATQVAADVRNDITDGFGNTFNAKTNLYVDNDLTVSENVNNTITIVSDTTFSNLFFYFDASQFNNVIVTNTEANQIIFSGNIQSLNVTTNTFIAQDLYVYNDLNLESLNSSSFVLNTLNSEISNVTQMIGLANEQIYNSINATLAVVTTSSNIAEFTAYAVSLG